MKLEENGIIENKLPMSWEQYKKENKKQHAINSRGDIYSDYIPGLIALHKLLLLRDAWGGGIWGTGEFTQSTANQCIIVVMEDGNYKVCKNFAFPNIGIMNEFDNTFADLIEEAKEVL